ncbi:MAG: DMT family transporter [Thermoleophilia bacterium]
MTAVVLALGAALSWGVADFMGGVEARRRALLTVLVISQAAGLALMLVVLAAHAGGPPPAAALAAAVVGGVLGAGSIAAFYAALARGSMGVVAPITATNAMIPLAVGMALGERPQLPQLLGLMAASIGVVLAAREPGGGSGDHRRSLVLALVAALLLGLTLVAYHRGAQDDLVWTVALGRLTSFGVLLGAALATRTGLRAGRGTVGVLAVVGVLDVGANLLFAAAATLGYLSVAGVLASLYPVVTVALARARLRERVSAPQQAGVALALSGVALISLG